jgi:adenine-specific DNA-methyltransferase
LQCDKPNNRFFDKSRLPDRSTSIVFLSDKQTSLTHFCESTIFRERHIGPKFGSVSKRAVNEAVRAFRDTRLQEGASWLVLLGFSFQDSIDDKDYNLGQFTVSKVRMHDDLMQDGLLKKDKGAGSFITIGEPDIALVVDSPDSCHVEIRGLDIYDPIKDDVKARSVEDIAYWEIDDNYDGRQFIVKSLHFCGGDKKEFDTWKKGLNSISSLSTKKKAEHTLRLELDDEMWEKLYGFESESLQYIPGRKIAVRVISQFGEESSKVITMK